MAAYDDARIFALRGLGFEAIVERLETEKGLDQTSARAAAAKALAPDPLPKVSLAAELAEIVASLDRSS